MNQELSDTATFNSTKRNAACFLAIAAVFLGHACIYNFINDDAFISFRYAQNLVEHGELTYNLGERVEGYTNFLWTIIIAIVLKLHADPVVWSKILGVCCSLGTLVAVWRFCEKQVPGRASNLLAPLCLALCPSFACWSTGGLETALFTLTCTMGGTRYLLERRDLDCKLPTSGLWFGLAALTRPEGLLFFGLTGLHRLLELLFVEKRPPRKLDWIWGLSFAALYVPYQIWRYSYYGWPFPNTYYVKTGATAFWKKGIIYTGHWILTHALFLFPFLLFFRKFARRTFDRGLLSLQGLYIGALLLHVIRVGGDFMALHRFYVPIMPGIVLLSADGLRGLWVWLSQKHFSTRSLNVIFVVIFAGFAGLGGFVAHKNLKVGSQGGVDSIGWLQMFADQCSAIGKHINATAPANARLATTAAGALPFYAKRYTLDILGLNDLWIAHNVKPHGNRPGHTKAAPFNYLMDQKIDYLIYQPTISEKPSNPRSQLSNHGYKWENYKVPGMTPPYWGVWVKQKGLSTPKPNKP